MNVEDIQPSQVPELLFAIEAALPFVRAHVGARSCSSSGGPAALEAILKKYNWDTERWHWLPLVLPERAPL